MSRGIGTLQRKVQAMLSARGGQMPFDELKDQFPHEAVNHSLHRAIRGMVERASERYLLPRLMTSFIRRFFSSISSRVRPFFIRLRSSRSSGVIAASASRRLALERLAASSRLFLGGPKTTILSRFLRDLYHSRSLRWSVKVF